MNPQELIDRINAQAGRKVFNVPLHFHRAIRKHDQADWQWPVNATPDMWAALEYWGLHYAKQKEVVKAIEEK